MTRPAHLAPLLDREHVVAAARGVRARRALPATARSPDSWTGRMTDTLAEPFTTPEDVEERLSAAERRFADADDQRAVFLTVYRRVTQEVRAALDHDVFEDPEWVSEYLVAFAECYREAVVGHERGERVPGAWRLAFEADERTLVGQHALLGINAHVTHDLAHALAAVGIDPDRERCYRDHCAVNRILERLVDVEQELLATHYAPGLADVDERLGRLDEELAFATLARGRAWAWHGAVALTDARRALTRRGVCWFLDTTATGAGWVILGVATPVRGRLRALERGER